MVRDVEVLIEGRSFLEGPRWHDGRLYLSDFFGLEVLAIAPGGEPEVVCDVPQQPSGLGFDPEGRLLVVSMLDRRLLRLEDGELVELGELSRLAAFPANDMTVDGQGRAYVGNFGWNYGVDDEIEAADLVRIDPDGTTSLAAAGVVFPNGCVVTPDGGTLLLSETFAGRISAWDVAADGTLANRRVWADLAPGCEWRTVPEAVASGLPLPDGIALDAEGALWIGDAAGSGALRVAEGGEILDTVPTGELSAYAVALGGEDRRTLYMCTSPPLLQTDPSVDHRASLRAYRVDVPGV
ncbi:MAG: SMP-30/gluconolactonase/LRE family protein [Actinobacteria bacterium]|nr:SMP-30/gluconolactonase/LRE family protein [Actinomycetota bacterium]